jgi:hypothetical protein
MQLLLQTQDNLERHQQLFGGLIAILRVATIQDTDDLLRFIRTKADMSQVAAHVRNTLRMNPHAQEVFNSIDFVIDGSLRLPSPSQLLSEQPARDSALIKRNTRLDR